MENKNIFISYSWTNKNIVDKIDNDFQKFDIMFQRDIRDSEYATSIKEFMKKIKKADFVLMIISKEFLKSENCMYEVIELIEDKNYKDRFLPIVLKDTGIFKTEGIIEYIKYWDGEYRRLNEELKRIGEIDLSINLQGELKKIKNIRENFGKFAGDIKDINTKTLEELQNNNYKFILEKIGYYKETKFQLIFKNLLTIFIILFIILNTTYNSTILPTSVDLRKWFSPIENQGNLHSSTANAGVGLIEYYEKKTFGKYVDASRLFLYKTTKNLLGKTGDSGAYIRTTMEAMARFGIVPEKYWPYETANFDLEPTPFCYSLGKGHKVTKYLRLDPSTLPSKEILLKIIKKNLAAGIPAMFGFGLFSSIKYANKNGKIPFPQAMEKYEGSHAVVAAGYDDNMIITHPLTNEQTKGAILIRNCWGEKWGEKGYGWLPYEYILKGLAVDWWIILKMDWIDTSDFQ